MRLRDKQADSLFLIIRCWRFTALSWHTNISVRSTHRPVNTNYETTCMNDKYIKEHWTAIQRLKWSTNPAHVLKHPATMCLLLDLLLCLQNHRGVDAHSVNDRLHTAGWFSRTRGASAQSSKQQTSEDQSDIHWVTREHIAVTQTCLHRQGW